MLEFLPPRQQRQVTISGYMVPHVEAREVNNGRDCNIWLDNRWGITVPAVYAAEVISLIAHAMAIGAGFSCHGKNSQPANPFKIQVCEIEASHQATDREQG